MKMKLIRYFLLIIIGFGQQQLLTAQEFIPLWPEGKKPNSNGKPISDSISNDRIWKVATPGLFLFNVPAAENKGTAVLICPGGGYERVSYLYNGFNLAKWYNSIGINAYVLKYRLPHQDDLNDRVIAPLQDAQRAMRIIRSNALLWKLKTDKIGVMGVSAGGHLASTLATHSEDVSAIKDLLDTINYKPDFVVLLSPVITMGNFAHAGSKKNLLGKDTSSVRIRKYSNELKVSSSTAPTFIVHALNDSTVKVQNSLLYYNALLANKVNASIHIFPFGGHGIRMDDNPGSTDLWLDLLERWLKETGMVLPIPFK